MAEIRALPWNGLTVASTFSGGGGSSCGYKMAGFKVAWASEFVEAARDTYRANFPDTTVDGRDIRDVRPEDVLVALGKREGELDLFDGSPPCASFSVAGKREKKWGTVSAYSDTKQRTDDLFFEYVRLVRGIRPKVFVAENVAGLVRGAARGYFVEIFEALKSCGYRVRAELLDAQWLGVPQQRNRVIFIGVRDDLGLDPVHPKPFPYRYALRDALEGANADLTVERLEGYAIGEEYKRLKPGGQSEKYFSMIRPDELLPCPTVTATGGTVGAAGVVHPTEARKFTIAELRRVCSFPDDFALEGTYKQQWERCGRAVPPLMMRAVAATLRDEVFAKIGR